MNYIARQVISLIKALRKELQKHQRNLHHDLAHLSGDLKNLQNSVETHRQTETKSSETQPSIAVTEPSTQVPISVQTYAQRSKKEGTWRVAKSILEVIVGLAVIGYTAISYETWQEQIGATNFSAMQTELSRKGLSEVTKNFRLDQRPWIGVVSIDESVPSTISEPITIKIRLINSGKTPSFDTRASWETNCAPITKIVKPIYTERNAKGRSTVMPGQDLWLQMEDKAICSPEDIALFRSGKATLYTMGTIWYRDEFRQAHRTDFCYYVRLANGEVEKLQTSHAAISYPNACRHYNHAN